jgi:hypothetical protein
MVKSNVTYDFVLVGNEALAIVQRKYTVRPEHLAELKQHVELYKLHAKEFEHYQIYAGIASKTLVDPCIMQQAQLAGYFVLQQMGQTLNVCANGMRAH